MLYLKYFTLEYAFNDFIVGTSLGFWTSGKVFNLLWFTSKSLDFEKII